MQNYPGPDNEFSEELIEKLEIQVGELSDSLSTLYKKEGGQYFYNQGGAWQSVIIDPTGEDGAEVALMGSDERTIESPEHDYSIEQNGSDTSIYDSVGQLLGTVQQGDTLEFFPEKDLEDAFRIALDVIGIINGAAGTYQ